MWGLRAHTGGPWRAHPISENGAGAPPHMANEDSTAARGFDSIDSGQGSASPLSPESAGFALLFDDAVLPGRVYGPGRLPAYARFLGGVERPANLFRLGRLDRCAGSARKRIERNGLLSSSGVPSWGAKPARRIEAGLESRKAATWGSCLPPERGSTIAGQQRKSTRAQ